MNAKKTCCTKYPDFKYKPAACQAIMEFEVKGKMCPICMFYVYFKG